MQFSRRQFGATLLGTAFAGLAARAAAGIPFNGANEVAGYGDLVADPNRLLDLPKGFSYRVISRFGNLMGDGMVVPNRGDGMGCIDMGGGRLALIRNHELGANNFEEGPLRAAPGEGFAAYDSTLGERPLPIPGGTSTMIYNMQSGEVEKEWLSLAGTIRNCSGGVTPWGSWLSCEENTTPAGKGVGKDHGYVFEVPAALDGKMAEPLPLKAMGRFNHEAVCIDPATGIAYLTEDREDSLFYRFIPKVPGKLAEGGRLEAMVLKIPDTRNWSTPGLLKKGVALESKWIPLDNVEAPLDDLRKRGAAKGAALFARGEGIFWDEAKKQMYFTATSGGAAKYGQIFRYTPSKKEGRKGTQGRLELFLESDNPATYNLGDNIAVMPNGHLIVCEDQYTDITNNHLRGITPDGKTYRIARSALQTEFAGACFSPDGSTLFVNLYAPTTTFAITGPWDQVVPA